MKQHRMTHPLNAVLAAGLVASLALGASAAHAAFPDKPITMIVPFGPGGSFDKLARNMQDGLQKELGVPIVIKNEPGAGGRRGSVDLFKSKPDGYTIGWLHFPPFLSDQIFFDRKLPVDYRKIAVITMVAQGKDMIFLPKSSSYKSFADLKNAKQPVRFTSTGLGAMSWVSISALAAAVGFEAKFVFGYKSTPRAALGAARGDADGGIGGYRQISGLIDEVTPILIFNDVRSPHFPNVPSIKELGYPQLAGLGSPYVISAPPGTPKEIQDGPAQGGHEGRRQRRLQEMGRQRGLPTDRLRPGQDLGGRRQSGDDLQGPGAQLESRESQGSEREEEVSARPSVPGAAAGTTRRRLCLGELGR